jgi:hypothetical protein
VLTFNLNGFINILAAPPLLNKIPKPTCAPIPIMAQTSKISTLQEMSPSSVQSNFSFMSISIIVIIIVMSISIIFFIKNKKSDTE